MKTSFLLISTNFHPEPTATGKYNGELIEWLVKHGHNCTVITMYPHYPYWKLMAPYNNQFFKKETKRFDGSDSLLKVYRCPAYIPGKPTGKKRLIQEFTFLLSAFFVTVNLLFRKRIDYIIAVAPPFHMIFLARLYKFFKGGKIIYHIQDLQIDTARELGMLKSETFFKLLYKVEKRQFERADYVSSISDGMIKKIAQRTNQDILFFPNWVDVNLFYPLSDKDELKAQWGYNANQFVCLYAGGIGEKQGLDIIIKAAGILQHNKRFRFVICGFGQYRSYLENLAVELKLDNVDFLPLQDKSVFNEFLNMADIHLVIQKSKASDLALPSKLTTILSVGGASVVTASPATSMYNLVNKYEVGFACEPDNASDLANTLIIVAGKDLESYRRNAVNYAKKYIQIDNVMQSFVANISE